MNFINRNSQISDLSTLLSAALNEPVNKCRFKIVNVEHHLAHISSSYFTSPLDKAKAISIDGSGDFVTAMLANCHGSKIDVVYRCYLPNSLGHFYSAMCQFIGFTKFGEEYKVMGLAPYGENTYEKELKEVLKFNNRNIMLNEKFVNVSKAASLGNIETMHETIPTLYEKKLQRLLGDPRIPGEPITQRDMNIAKSTQIVFEQAAFGLLNGFLKPGDNLVQAGGCSLNGVNNAKILNKFDIGQYYLHSAASDDGTAVGAAFYVWNSLLEIHRVFI